MSVMSRNSVDGRARNVVEAASLIAAVAAPDGGLCLPVTAAVTHVLAAAGIGVVAVCGSYRDQAHWWVLAGDTVLDATRGQFDHGPLIFPVSEAVDYEAEQRFPPGWTREHVILEARRAFYFIEAADQFGNELLRILEMAVREEAA